MPDEPTPHIIDRDGRIVAPLACVQCAADLLNLTFTDRCPHCSSPTLSTISLHVRTIGRDGRVRADIPCNHCQYNLRTQPLAGNCPECNHPVRMTVLAARLEDFSLDWLRKLHSGARRVIQGTVLGMLVAVFDGIALVSPPPTAGTASVVLQFLTLFVFDAFAGVWTFFGLYNFTTPNAAVDATPSTASIRWRARTLVHVLVALFAISRVCALLDRFVSTGPNPTPSFDLAANCFESLCFLVGCFLLLSALSYTRDLLALVPAPDVRQHANAQRRSFIALFVALLVSLASTAVGPLAGCFLLITGICILIWIFALFVLFIRVYFTLANVRKRAESQTASPLSGDAP